MDYFKSYQSAGNACLAVEEREEHRCACFDKAIADAWEDSNKLADACDSEQVQRWLRELHADVKKEDEEQVYLSASFLDAAIEQAFINDPMFDQWVQEAKQAIDP